MKKIVFDKSYLKGRDKCAGRGLDLAKLDAIVEILRSRNFTPDEAKIYYPHKLDGKNKDYWELHIGGRRSDWVLKYKYSADKSTLILANVGKHDDIFGSDLKIQ